MWYVSDKWESVLRDCGEWRELAILQVNDPGLHPIGSLYDLGQRIAAWCDAETHIDPSPLAEIWRLAEANQPAKCITKRGHTLWQHNPATYGGKPAAGAMEAAMWRAIDVLDRLYALGTTQQPPAGGEPAGPASIAVDLAANKVTIEGETFDVEPHHARFVDMLVNARDAGGASWYVTGTKLKKLPGCKGKKISREMKALKAKVPALNVLITSRRVLGYRLTR